MQQSKARAGSVIMDGRSKRWQFFWWANGRRHGKTLGHFPTKTAAWNAAQAFRVQPPNRTQTSKGTHG
jgi:hypothetical protein